MSTKARFICTAIIDYGKSKKVLAEPAFKQEAGYKPDGKLELMITDLPTAEMFAPGKYFIAEFTPEQ